MFAIGYDDSSVQVYSTQPPYTLLTTFNAAHGNGAIKLDISSTYLMTCGGNNNKVKLWDIATQTETYSYNINNVV